MVENKNAAQTLSEAAAILGRATSPAKAEASQRNGKRGGRKAGTKQPHSLTARENMKASQAARRAREKQAREDVNQDD